MTLPLCSRGCPAHAGMLQSHVWSGGPRGREPGLPRTRGDAPPSRGKPRIADPVAPHTRGCSPEHHRGGGAVPGCPAHAGMLLSYTILSFAGLRLPRTRGDAPQWISDAGSLRRVAPHTRGCSPEAPGPRDDAEGCPAHAGMLPATHEARVRRSWLPRTRGDAPVGQLARVEGHLVAPHTRGCSLHLLKQGRTWEGCPAHAGMLPACCTASRRDFRLPRTRGDAPQSKTSAAVMLRVAPHTRGCSLR